MDSRVGLAQPAACFGGGQRDVPGSRCYVNRRIVILPECAAKYYSFPRKKLVRLGGCEDANSRGAF